MNPRHLRGGGMGALHFSLRVKIASVLVLLIDELLYDFRLAFPEFVEKFF